MKAGLAVSSRDRVVSAEAGEVTVEAGAAAASGQLLFGNRVCGGRRRIAALDAVAPSNIAPALASAAIEQAQTLFVNICPSLLLLRFLRSIVPVTAHDLATAVPRCRLMSMEKPPSISTARQILHDGRVDYSMRAWITRIAQSKPNVAIQLSSPAGALPWSIDGGCVRGWKSRVLLTFALRARQDRRHTLRVHTPMSVSGPRREMWPFPQSLAEFATSAGYGVRHPSHL